MLLELYKLTLYESWLDSGWGSHWNLTSPVSASVLWRRFWTGRGRVVTLPVAGHEATDPDTVLTTTWKKKHEKNGRKKNYEQTTSPGKFCRGRGSQWTWPRGERLSQRSEDSCGGYRWPPGTWGYRQMSVAWSIFLVSWRWPIHCKQTTFLAHTTTTINIGHKYAADCQKIALSLLHHHGHWYLCQLYLRDCDPLIEKKPRTVRTPINMFTQRK